MSAKMRSINRILDSQQDYLRNIRDDIVAGVREGLRQGGSKGAKKGAWHGLKEECLPQGLINIEDIPTEDIVGAISRVPIIAGIAQALRPEIKSGVGMYLDLVAAGITKIPHSRMPSTEDIVQLVMRRYEAKDWIEEMLPRNPIAKGIAAGIGSAFQKALTDSIETFSAKIEGIPDGDRKGTGEESANQEGDERLWQVRRTIRDSVRDTVARVAEELAYETTKQITRRVIANLKKKLRQKSIHRLEEVLRKMAEQEFRKGLDKAADRFGEELIRDCADVRNLVDNIERGFEKGFEKYLSSLVKWLTPLKAIGITCAGLVMVGGAVYALWNNPPVISDVIPNPSIVHLGEGSVAEIAPLQETSIITCVASDPDNDKLSYRWRCSGGIITNEGNEVIWTAPEEEGMYEITVVVADGKGNTATGNCRVSVVAPPVLTCSTSSIDFGSVESDYTGPRTFQVWNSGGGTLSYSLAPDASWLSLSSTSGECTSEYDDITVYIDTSELDEGSSESATIDISSNGGTCSILVSVNVVSPPILTCSPFSINFGEVLSGYRDSYTFEVWNSGGGTLYYSLSEAASWLSLSSTSGTSTGEHDDITFYIDTSGLSVGLRVATISISSNGETCSISVSVSVVAPPILICSPSSIDFGSHLPGFLGSKTFSVWNSGGGTLYYSLSDDASWLWLDPTSGISTGEYDVITVYADTSKLFSGPLVATIDISSNGGTCSVSVSARIPG